MIAPVALSCRNTLVALNVYDDPHHRPVVVADGGTFVDGRPYDAWTGHYIRIRRATLPPQLASIRVIACNIISDVALIDDDDPLVPVDERYCRGPFTAIACEPNRCWLAGWY